MQEDLVVAKKLGDTVGECRAHANLGSAYFSKANYKVKHYLYHRCYGSMEPPPIPAGLATFIDKKRSLSTNITVFLLRKLIFKHNFYISIISKYM